MSIDLLTEENETMQRCRDCKFYTMPTDDSINGYANVGDCARILIGDRRSYGAGPQTLSNDETQHVFEQHEAAVTDGEDYLARLRPGPDFGCTLWEKKTT